MAFANRLYVRTFIPETKLGRVKMGMPARVTVDAFPNREFPAHITEIERGCAARLDPDRSGGRDFRGPGSATTIDQGGGGSGAF